MKMNDEDFKNLKIGDRVKIIKSGCIGISTCPSIGSIVRVKDRLDDHVSLLNRDSSCSIGECCWFSANEIEVVEKNLKDGLSGCEKCCHGTGKKYRDPCPVHTVCVIGGWNDAVKDCRMFKSLSYKSKEVNPEKSVHIELEECKAELEKSRKENEALAARLREFRDEMPIHKYGNPVDSHLTASMKGLWPFFFSLLCSGIFWLIPWIFRLENYYGQVIGSVGILVVGSVLSIQTHKRSVEKGIKSKVILSMDEIVKREKKLADITSKIIKEVHDLKIHENCRFLIENGKRYLGKGIFISRPNILRSEGVKIILYGKTVCLINSYGYVKKYLSYLYTFKCHNHIVGTISDMKKKVDEKKRKDLVNYTNKKAKMFGLRFNDLS